MGDDDLQFGKIDSYFVDMLRLPVPHVRPSPEVDGAVHYDGLFDELAISVDRIKGAVVDVKLDHVRGQVDRDRAFVEAALRLAQGVPDPVVHPYEPDRDNGLVLAGQVEHMVVVVLIVAAGYHALDSLLGRLMQEFLYGQSAEPRSHLVKVDIVREAAFQPGRPGSEKLFRPRPHSRIDNVIHDLPFPEGSAAVPVFSTGSLRRKEGGFGS
jgi:hypothetical protein